MSQLLCGPYCAEAAGGGTRGDAGLWTTVDREGAARGEAARRASALEISEAALRQLNERPVSRVSGHDGHSQNLRSDGELRTAHLSDTHETTGSHGVIDAEYLENV